MKFDLEIEDTKEEQTAVFKFRIGRASLRIQAPCLVNLRRTSSLPEKDKGHTTLLLEVPAAPKS